MSRSAYITALLLICFSSVALAENWPGWRGPQHNGISSEKNLPLQWSASNNVLWKLPIPGVGHSSPIVWKNKIFVTSCTLEDEARRLYCVDRNSGAILWQKLVATSPIEKMHRDNTPASATPVCDGTAVFTAFQVDGQILISAYDLGGSPLWSRPAGNFESRHGFCTSLVLDGNRLLVSGLQDGPDAFVAAFNKQSGDLIWSTPRRDKVRSFSSPLLCKVDERKILLLSGANQTVAYDRQTGSVVWELDGPAEKTVSSIVTCPDSNLAFVCGGRNDGFLAVSLDKPKGSKPEVKWEAHKGIPYMTSPLASKNNLHILSDEGIYRCYETSTGKKLREFRPVGPVRASMVANEDYIFVTEKSGKTTVIKNDSTWTVVAENELDEEVLASAAISDGDFVLRGTNNLYLIRESSATSE